MCAPTRARDQRCKELRRLDAERTALAESHERLNIELVVVTHIDHRSMILVRGTIRSGGLRRLSDHPGEALEVLSAVRAVAHLLGPHGADDVRPQPDGFDLLDELSVRLSVPGIERVHQARIA